MKEYILKPNQPGPSNLQIDYQKELNDEQYKVVTGGEGSCLVLAGAGSGKTRTLVYRVAYLLEKGVRPDRILLVTFTNKAAKEMLNRIEVLLKNPPKGLWGGTFHHIGNRFLRMYGSRIGIDSNFTILDEEDSKTLVKSCYSSVNVPDDKYFPKADLVRKIISLSANLARPVDEIIGLRFAHINNDYVEIIEKITKLYKARKRSNNALDYDDLLGEWNRLLLENEEVREKLSRQFQYVLVDEYQDTNHIQSEIINHMAGTHKNVLVVGDDSQSIYSFRGADVKNILTFPQDFPDCQTFRLETNYRSTPEILALANESIKNNNSKFEKNLKTHKTSGARPALAALEDGYKQADFICQRILDLQEGESMSLKSIAVLFRAHYHSMELELELNKRNIPYIMRGGQRFFEQAHIKDVVAHLKIINNIHDELSWLRILQLQAGVGMANAQKIWQVISGLNTMEEILAYPFASAISPRVFNGWNKASSDFERLIIINKDDVSSQIEVIINSGYDDFVKNNFENYQDRIDDLDQLVVFAKKYDTLDKFLADVALSEGFQGEVVAGDGSEVEAVTLSTIHQAKGLEWKAVFVIGLVDGQFPNAKSFDKIADIEEERRLFYVAVTRAEDQLYLTYPMFSAQSGQMNGVSQFVQELPEDVYEEWRVRDGILDDDSDDDDDVRYVDEDEEYKSDGDVSDQFWKRFMSRKK